MKIKSLLSSVAIILILVGCGNSTKTNVTPLKTKNSVNNLEKNISQKPIKNFYIQLKKASYLSLSAGYSQSMIILKKDIKKKLKLQYPNSNFVNSFEEKTSGMKVQLMINNFNYVSGAKRFFTGIMGGNATLNFDLILHDMKSGDLIKEEKIALTSSKWAGIFGDTTSTQLSFASEKIVSIISQSKI